MKLLVEPAEQNKLGYTHKVYTEDCSVMVKYDPNATDFQINIYGYRHYAVDDLWCVYVYNRNNEKSIEFLVTEFAIVAAIARSFYVAMDNDTLWTYEIGKFDV